MAFPVPITSRPPIPCMASLDWRCTRRNHQHCRHLRPPRVLLPQNGETWPPCVEPLCGSRCCPFPANPRDCDSISLVWCSNIHFSFLVSTLMMVFHGSGLRSGARSCFVRERRSFLSTITHYRQLKFKIVRKILDSL